MASLRFRREPSYQSPKEIPLVPTDSHPLLSNNATTDWTLRENVRAQLPVLVRPILRKYGYPPGKQEKTTQTVLEQAEVLSQEWAVV